MKKPYRGRDGKPQLWFKPGEIDDWMEAELHRAGLYPTPDRPAVDIESFVDRHLQVALEQYADLEPHVLGQTRFEAGDEADGPHQSGPDRTGHRRGGPRRPGSAASGG